MTREHRLRCAHDIERSSNLNTLLQTLWDDLRRDSGGRLDVSLHPDGELGGPDDMVDQLLDNRLQFHAVSGMILSRITPVVAAEGLAFAYASSRHGCEAMAGDVGDAVRAALRARGLHALRQVLPQGMNQIITRGRAVRGLADLQGLRLRIGNSPYLKDLYGSLGCDPQPIDLQQVAPALRDGRAEGVEMIYYGILAADRHRYLDHVGQVDVRFACFWLCVNLQAWQALGPQLQDLVERRYAELAQPYAEELDRTNERARAFLQSQGYAFTEVDRAALQRRLRETGFYDRWRERLGEPVWQAILHARRPGQEPL